MPSLNYDQRKALRRLGRGQTIRRRMWDDPIIRDCIDTSHYIEPPDPQETSIVEWCDWEAHAMSCNRPRINQYGKTLLEELEASNT